MGIPSVFMIVTDVSDAFTNRHPSFEGAVDDHQPRPSNFHCTPLESIPLPYRPAQKLTLQSFDEILLPPILGNDGFLLWASVRHCGLANEEESVDASLGVLGAECAVATKDLQTENLMAALLNLQTGSNSSAWDVASDSVICAFGPNEKNVAIELKRWKKNEKAFEPIASWDAPCPLPDLECDEILDLHHFSDSLTISLVLAGGDLIVVREASHPGEEKIEIVGSVDAGISTAAWSPDEELLAITTRAATLLYMTRNFENVIAVTLIADDLKASNHVSVGWGKVETQFKGKKARALRDPTVPETVDEGRLNEHDANETSISWRGDGAYLAINSIESGSRRVIRVLSREGILDSVSEPVDGLVGALSWRPAGNLLAGIQRLQEGIKVVFFERNGLRHGQFDLRLNEEERRTWGSYISLSWNVNSSVLGVRFKDRIQLWVMGNYHWYLKQEIVLSTGECSVRPISLTWHPEKPLHFILHAQESIQRFAYASILVNDSASPPDDYGVVAVIDGKCLKLTAMRLANIPPPMALHEIIVDSNIIDAAVTIVNGLATIIVSHQSGHTQFQWSLKDRKLPVLDTSMDIPSAGVDAQPEVLPQIGLQETIADAIETLAVEDKSFSLTENGSLFANHRRLARNCTSFLVTPAHLIFTTSQHLLKFVHTTDDIEELEIPADTPESDERCRSIERGARLVAVMPSIFALVMQMPRGNLETIYPRALVLAGIRDSINRKQYKKAFLACRNQRVDLNILHDYAPKQFIANVALFIEQVEKVEHIDLFLSQLRDEDVSKTMYRETLPQDLVSDNTPDAQVVDSRNHLSPKVNRICDAFLDALKKRTSTHFQNVVTSHVCKIPPDLESGLAQIAGLREKNPELIDAAIEHICFLTDVNRLYDHALGLYDLKLALLVAQQSQKDPKEYLPFLQNLQGMYVLRRRYSIDNYLGRWQKALKHLCELDAFDEVKAYIVKHSLYPEGLGLYRYQEEKLRDVLQLYADFLQHRGSFEEAGTAYESLNDYKSASEAFRQAHLWKQSLSCATLIPLPSAELASLAQTLADTLIESKDFFSAATIYLDYLSDVSSAAHIFCKGYFFADALRILGLHTRIDLLESIVDGGLAEGMASMTELLADCKSQLNAQIPRIRELRAKKAQDPLAFFDGDIHGGADVPDNVSIAPTDASNTGGSLFTQYTNRTGTVGTNATRRTSKNRRREERKKARGKKGSVYEEEYLISSVGRLIERINTVNSEVKRLVNGMMRRGMRERARAVENAMTEVVELCKGCLEEVFGSDVKEVSEKPKEDREEEKRPKGGDIVLWESLDGGNRRPTPVVMDFERLSLLGR